MWVPSAVADWFKISKESVDALREENAALKAELAVTKSQLIVTQSNFGWLATRVNALEVERAQLIKIVYKIDVAIPQVVRSPVEQFDLNADIFNDVGEDTAKKLGLPTYQ